MKRLILASILLCASLFLSVARAEYDPEAEVARLIEKAQEEKAKLQELLQKTKVASEKAKQDFLTLNATAQDLGETLKRIRTIDARNKAMLLVKTGLNITAVNAPETLLELGVGVVVDTGSETLKNHYPSLFDTSVTVEFKRLGSESVKAVRKFNQTLGEGDDVIEARIKIENPELAKDRGALYETVAGFKLTDDLIALKRAQYLIQEGSAAEGALQSQKNALAAKRQQLLQIIADLEREIKGQDETIRSWERSRGVYRDIKELSKVKEPEPVKWEPDPKYDFGSARGKMQAAMEGLKSNRLDASGYSAELSNAWRGAQRLFSEQYARMWDANCGGWDYDKCMRAIAHFYATVGAQYKDMVDGTLDRLGKEMEQARKEGQAFMGRLNKWNERTVSVPADYWDTNGREVPIGGFEGNNLAESIFGYGLVISPTYVAEWFIAPVNGLSLEALQWPNYLNRKNTELWLNSAQEMQKKYEAMYANARTAVRTVESDAQEATAMAQELEPKRQLWSAALYQDLTAVYVHLRRFQPTFTQTAAGHMATADKLRAVFQEGVNRLQNVYSALAPEVGILQSWAKAEEIKYRTYAAADNAGANLARGLNTYPLWGMLKANGITKKAIDDIKATLPKLSEPKDAIKDWLERQQNTAPGSSRMPVRDASGVDSMRSFLKDRGRDVIASQSEYRDLYNQLASSQEKLTGSVNAMKSAVESANANSPSGLSAPQVLDTRVLLAPNDMPDPTAGVFEQLDEYAKVAAEYHKILAPMEPWTFWFYEALDKLAKRVKEEGPARESGDLANFQHWWNDASHEWTTLQQRAGMGGTRTVSRTSPFGKLSSEVMASLMEMSGRVAERQRVARARQELQDALARARQFLANPDSQGGVSGAQFEIGRLDAAAAPGSAADQAKGSAAVAGLIGELASVKAQLQAYLSKGGDAAVRKLYQEFAAAYQTRNLTALLRFLSPDWMSDDGSDVRDLETTLGNSFRVFDSLAFAISGLSIQQSGNGFQASYTVKVTGRIRRLQKDHAETASVTDFLEMTSQGLRIRRTSGGIRWR